MAFSPAVTEIYAVDRKTNDVIRTRWLRRVSISFPLWVIQGKPETEIERIKVQINSEDDELGCLWSSGNGTIRANAFCWQSESKVNWKTNHQALLLVTLWQWKSKTEKLWLNGCNLNIRRLEIKACRIYYCLVHHAKTKKQNTGSLKGRC